MTRMSDAEYPVPLEMIAAADQEIAAIRNRLNELIALWTDEQPRYTSVGLDDVARLCAFLVEHVRPGLNDTGARAMLTMAIQRLAQRYASENDPLCTCGCRRSTHSDDDYRCYSCTCQRYER